MNNLISQEEKKTKSTDFIKIHETEKNNYSMLTTSRRCKLLQDALPEKEKTVLLKVFQLDGKLKEFEFKISKKSFEFPKQSASNNSIHHADIYALCKNINCFPFYINIIIFFTFLQKIR